MKITAWRIYKPKHASTAFTGEGARRFGGRFNRKGVAVVYTAESVSLAALEMLVHLQSKQILDAYVVRPVTFDAALVKRIIPANLPPGWRDNPPPIDAQRIGTDWVACAESAVLQVPNAVVESESNFLLNPSHADFSKVRLGPEHAYRFDPRLVKSR